MSSSLCLKFLSRILSIIIVEHLQTKGPLWLSVQTQIKRRPPSFGVSFQLYLTSTAARDGKPVLFG